MDNRCFRVGAHHVIVVYNGKAIAYIIHNVLNNAYKEGVGGR